MKTKGTLLTIGVSLLILAATALAGSETRHEKLHITKERGGFLAVSAALAGVALVGAGLWRVDRWTSDDSGTGRGERIRKELAKVEERLSDLSTGLPRELLSPESASAHRSAPTAL